MSHASAIPPGGSLRPTRKGWNSSANRVSDLERTRVGDQYEVDPTPDPYADEPKWAAWKVTLALVIFCGAFWAGISYLAMRLLG